jgi:hypothetical protein
MTEERLRAHLEELGYEPWEIEEVISQEADRQIDEDSEDRDKDAQR